MTKPFAQLLDDISRVRTGYPSREFFCLPQCSARVSVSGSVRDLICSKNKGVSGFVDKRKSLEITISFKECLSILFECQLLPGRSGNCF